LKILLLTLAISSSLFSGQAMAQTSLTGEIGVDLQNYIFDKALKDTSFDYSVNRSLTNHYLDTRLAGPLITQNLAAYSARTLVYGTYTRVTSDDGNSGLYIKPNLRAYNTSLTLFPSRPYPLMLYMSKSLDHSIRYEPNNRSDIERVAPELAVIRRYETELRSRGGRWNSSLSEHVNVTAEYKQDGMQVNRNYDLDENLNIWVAFTTLLIDPTSETHTIDVRNNISDDMVTLYIDYILIDSLAAGESFTVEVDSGYHNLDFVPRKYKSYSSRVQVRGDMIWDIIYNPPPTPNDLDQTTTAATGSIRIEDARGLNNETYYGYSDITEKNQNLITYMNNFSNTADYAISSNADLQLMTTYNQNQTTIDTISSQLAKSFSHQSTLGFGRKRGSSMLFSHMFTRMASDIGSSHLRSNTNVFTNQNRIPFGWHNYQLDVKNMVTLVSDNSGYQSDQYGTDITNGFVFRIGQAVFNPRNQTKYTYNKLKNPDGSSNELENIASLTSNIPDMGVFGKLRAKGEFGWRRKTNELGDDIRRKMILDITLERRFLTHYKISIGTTQQKEMYSGSTPTPGQNTDQRNPAREDQLTQSYKVSAQLSPFADFVLGADYMLLSQNSADINKFTVSLNATIPWLKIPLKSYLTSQRRKLEGLPDQTQILSETKLSYRFRQITLTLSHSYTSEDIMNEKYEFQEIIGKVSRFFSVF